MRRKSIISFTENVVNKQVQVVSLLKPTCTCEKDNLSILFVFFRNNIVCCV